MAMDGRGIYMHLWEETNSLARKREVKELRRAGPRKGFRNCIAACGTFGREKFCGLDADRVQQAIYRLEYEPGDQAEGEVGRPEEQDRRARNKSQHLEVEFNTFNKEGEISGSALAGIGERPLGG